MNFNPKPYERLLKRFLVLQAVSIDQMISNIIAEVTRQAGRVEPPQDEDFSFSSYPALSKSVDMALMSLSRQLTDTITTGTQWSWNLANMKNDDMLARIVRSIGAARIPAGALERWTQKNLPALEAFQQRKIGGMGLSKKVWSYVKGMKGDLELALDLGLGEGKSADSLSRSVRRFLLEPDRLYRRVRDEKGVLRLSKAASNYHPGQGVYRSSYKNARRLAATETNMAYRTSDFNRVQQLDFILGIEVHLSNNHTCLNAKGEPEPFYDICDELQGRYPKDFKFTGWHPLCRCYTTTILPDKDEFLKYLDGIDENGNSTYQFKDEVTEMPDNFNRWVEENQDRIRTAEERGKLPYFLKDNPDAWDITPAVPPLGSEEMFDAISKEYNIRFGDYKDYSDSTASRFDFLGFKGDVEDMFGIKTAGTLSLYDETSWRFSLRGNGFALTRYFFEDEGKIICEHEYFELDKKLQGKGLSKKLFNSLYTQYQNVGVQKLEVHANIDVGGYTWARYGFSTMDKKQAMNAIRYFGDKYPELFEKAYNTIEDYYKNNRLVDSNPFPMNLLTPWGKPLLLGSDWNGVLDFSDKKQLAIWESYLKG